MYDCEGYGGEFVFVYYELPKLEPLEYTGIELKNRKSGPNLLRLFSPRMADKGVRAKTQRKIEVEIFADCGENAKKQRCD